MQKGANDDRACQASTSSSNIQTPGQENLSRVIGRTYCHFKRKPLKLCYKDIFRLSIEYEKASHINKYTESTEKAGLDIISNHCANDCYDDCDNDCANCYE